MIPIYVVVTDAVKDINSTTKIELFADIELARFYLKTKVEEFKEECDLDVQEDTKDSFIARAEDGFYAEDHFIIYILTKGIN